MKSTFQALGDKRRLLVAAPGLVTFALAGALLASSAYAEEAAMRVVRDAETGELRAPTAAEIAALDAATKALAASSSSTSRRIAAAPATSSTSAMVMPNGAKRAFLGAEHHAYSVASKTADGKLSYDCIQGEQAAVDKATDPSKSALQSAPKHKEHAHESR